MGMTNTYINQYIKIKSITLPKSPLKNRTPSPCEWYVNPRFETASRRCSMACKFGEPATRTHVANVASWHRKFSSSTLRQHVLFILIIFTRSYKYKRECVLCLYLTLLIYFGKQKGKKSIFKKKQRTKTKEVELFLFPSLGRVFSVIMTLHLFRLWVFLLPSKRSILGTFSYSAQFGLTRFPYLILIISGWQKKLSWISSSA